jgi:hypothetical protein
MTRLLPDRFDRFALVLLTLFALFAAARNWLYEHPQHNPWAPLELDHPIGWATAGKLVELRKDAGQCHAFLDRSEIDFEALPAKGEGPCRREDRLRLPSGSIEDLQIAPANAVATCPVHAGLAIWLRHGVQPAAEASLGKRVTAIEHLGTANCRRIGGGDTGRWSEHATGNAIDIAAFRLEDGRRISLLGDWRGTRAKAEFLRSARESACDVFGTVLSPDYNEAHADHFHLDQANRSGGWNVCR